MTKLHTTIEECADGTIRAFVNGYQYAETHLPATASRSQRQRARKALREKARRAYQREASHSR